MVHTIYFYFFNFMVRLYNIFDYWNVIKIFGSETFPSVFPNAKNYFNDSVWTSDAASHSSRNQLFLLKHLFAVMKTWIRWQKSQNFKRLAETEKKSLKSLGGKHRNNPHGKIEPMMKNSSFDVSQRQIKCRNNVAQNKFSFAVAWNYFSIGLRTVWGER